MHSNCRRSIEARVLSKFKYSVNSTGPAPRPRNAGTRQIPPNQPRRPRTPFLCVSVRADLRSRFILTSSRESNKCTVARVHVQAKRKRQVLLDETRLEVRKIRTHIDEILLCASIVEVDLFGEGMVVTRGEDVIPVFLPDGSKWAGHLCWG